MKIYFGSDPIEVKSLVEFSLVEFTRLIRLCLESILKQMGADCENKGFIMEFNSSSGLIGSILLICSIGIGFDEVRVVFTGIC